MRKVEPLPTRDCEADYGPETEYGSFVILIGRIHKTSTC